MRRAGDEPVAVAILAKAPVAGFAKTRLAPAIGAEAAAALQSRFLARTVATASAAATGPVRLWCDPDPGHAAFGALAAEYPLTLGSQPRGDLGLRMLEAVRAADGPVLVIGTDCPAMSEETLRAAAGHLRSGADVVLGPAEDGGYVLIGMRRPHAGLFEGITWSTASVAAETRRRLRAGGLRWRELPVLFDVDDPADLARMRRDGLGDLLDGIMPDNG